MPKCKVCKSEFKPMFSSLQKTCTKPECVHSWYLLNKDKTDKKVKADREKEKKVKYKQMKDRSAYLPKLKAEAKRTFQKYIRLRDTGMPCGSCGKNISSEKHDAGHVYKAETYSALIFDEDNVFSQCVYCNKTLDGNLAGFMERLPNRIGVERFEALKQRARVSLNVTVKRTREDYRQIIETYKQRIKDEKRIKNTL